MITESFIIKNANIFDGEKFIGLKDIQVSKGNIIKIASSINKNKSQIYYANKLILSPGFIDVHTHADLSVIFSDCINFLSQGVTTIIGGNCGISAGVDNGTDLQGIINVDNYKKDKWVSFCNYWVFLKRRKIAVNYASLIGHHTLIEESKKNNVSPHKLLKKYINLGILGLSTGLDYGNGEKVKSSNDLISFAKILAQNNGIITSHIRNQGKDLHKSVKMFTDLFDLLKNKNLRIEISHFKHKFYQDSKGHITLLKTFKLIEKYRKKGFNISIDAYPYNAGSTILSEKFAKDCKNDWDDVYPFKSGISIKKIAEKQKISEEQIVNDILKKEPGTLAVYRNTIREKDVNEILSKKYCLIGSDALPTHPRNSATFTKVLRFVIQNKLDLKEYLSRMTSKSADFFRLGKIGKIKEGYLADLVLFDKNKIKDKATFENPSILSEGIEKVWVTGELTYTKENGVISQSGRLIKRI